MTLWMKVTKDKYELPLIVAASLTELANICGVSKGSISSSIYHNIHDGVKTCYRKVEVEDDPELYDTHTPRYRGCAIPKVVSIVAITKDIVEDGIIIPASVIAYGWRIKHGKT